MTKFAAAVVIIGALGLGTAAPATAKPHHDDWCHGCNWGWDGGWYGPWYPGKWVDVCATGPWRYVSVCFG